MTLPTQVKVGAWVYTIERWDSTEAAGTRSFGHCSTNEKRIKVDTMWGTKKAAHTLFHEILHAVYYERGVEEKDPEERLVASLADGLAGVWHDNPEVMRWVGAGLKR